MREPATDVREQRAGDVPGAARCVTCGADALLDYCARCGERRPSANDYSLGRFAMQSIHAVTDVDSRLLRTLRLLLTRPGQLAAEHFAGRRQPSLGPLQLFLVCNILFFVVHTVLPVHVFTTTLSDHLQHQTYSRWLLSFEAAAGTTYGELLEDPRAFHMYARSFQSVTTAQAKSLIILMVPVFALMSYLAHGPRRWFYAQHLVHSLHLFAFLLLLMIPMGALLVAVVRLEAVTGVELSWQTRDGIFGLVTAIVIGLHLAAAGRRAFGERGWANGARAVLLTVLLVPILNLYRFVLFFTTRAVL